MDDKDRVTPFRARHTTKEARLEQMRARFEDAHPIRPGTPRPAGSAKVLLVFLAIAVAMIWLASTLAG